MKITAHLCYVISSAGTMDNVEHKSSVNQCCEESESDQPMVWLPPHYCSCQMFSCDDKILQATFDATHSHYKVMYIETGQGWA